MPNALLWPTLCVNCMRKGWVTPVDAIVACRSDNMVLEADVGMVDVLEKRIAYKAKSAVQFLVRVKPWFLL